MEGGINMSLNIECVRDILLEVEKKAVPDLKGKITAVNVQTLPDCMSLKKYSDAEIYYHVRFLFECGALKKGRQFITDIMPRINGITFPVGQSLLEKLRPKDAVQKILPILMKCVPEKCEDIIKMIIQTDFDRITQ